MDPTERVVAEFLEHLRLGVVEFEPDGNVPPDFRVGPVAIEARRLNQQFEYEDGHRGLEEASYPLHFQFERLLAELGPPIDGISWFVMYRFQRPVPDRRTVDQLVRLHLEKLPPESLEAKKLELRLGQGLELTLLRASEAHRDRFVLGGHMDMDSGGWVISELARNIVLCEAEKRSKIAPYLDGYSEWWLVLVDRISYGLSQAHGDRLSRHVSVSWPWTRITLVDPRDATRYFDLPTEQDGENEAGSCDT